MNFADFTPQSICRIFWDATGTLIRSRCHHSLEEGMGIRFHSRPQASTDLASFGAGHDQSPIFKGLKLIEIAHFQRAPAENPQLIQLIVNLIDFKYFSKS